MGLELIIIPILGFVITLMMEPGELLDFISEWTYDKSDNSLLFAKANKLITCCKCMSGQIGFWYSIYTGNSFMRSLIISALCIFGGHVLKILIDKWQN